MKPRQFTCSAERVGQWDDVETRIHPLQFFRIWVGDHLRLVDRDRLPVPKDGSPREFSLLRDLRGQGLEPPKRLVVLYETAERYDAVHAATRLYAKVLRAHPFIDGNLRAGIVALNAGLVMFGLGIVTFKDLERHDELLGIAFVGKHDPYRPLAEHITEIIAGTKRA